MRLPATARAPLPPVLALVVGLTAVADALPAQSIESQLRAGIDDPAGAKIGNVYALVAQMDAAAAERLAGDCAACVEQRQRPAASRSQALNLLAVLLGRVPLQEHAPRAQDEIARAVAHALTDPEPELRRRAIWALPLLQGRPERRDWLPDAERLLRLRLRGQPVERDQLRMALVYCQLLGADAAATLPLLEQLLLAANDEVRQPARLALAAIGCAAGRSAAVAAFQSLGRELQALAPAPGESMSERSAKLRQEGAIGAAMRKVLAGHDDLLREPDAAAAFLLLLERFQRDPKDAQLLSPLEQEVVGMFQRHALALGELADAALRQRALAACDAAMRPLAAHGNQQLRDAAQRWLRR